ncbi:AP-3 complex subunit beta-2 [Irineochytrium annulatum]|nr:AP-3 complex subunit beta-2 [Irineochytrium annulatum]
MRLTGMDADVVKNVASTSFEVRKLVYIYLLRYAEEQPDLALLSINTFQKDFTDKNPLIRAMALRVMSSIRVMIALKKGTTDLSPYVRKAAANAIPKCYSLDPTQKEHLVEIIESLLKDNSTLVLGSVIASFNQICPDRLDLIHKHFRKLCRLLIDADEWSQLEIVALLLRYARTQFLDPNVNAPPDVAAPSSSKAFYSDDEEGPKKKVVAKGHAVQDAIDEDHALLLKSCLPLIHSSNASVVFNVVKLFVHIAPAMQCHQPIKALTRLLHNPPEEQYVILLNILTIIELRPSVFRPYMRCFFLTLEEAPHLRDLKMEILAVGAAEENVNMIFKELKDYVRSPDRELVVKAVQVMGRISCRIHEVTEDCLTVLTALIASKDEKIVAESVVVTRQLIQLRPTANAKLIRTLARSVDSMTVPMARASIFWLVGQHCAIVPSVAPDTLRVGAKGFASEDAMVKLQILNLGVKLAAFDPTEVVRKIVGYVLALARFDVDYDIRDRARFFKALVAEGETDPERLRAVVLGEKSVPVQTSKYTGRERFTLGSMSHAINIPARGFAPLPDWPSVKPDPSTRVVPETQEAWNRDRVVSSAVREIRRPGSKPASPQKKVVDLDNFYNSEEDDEEEEEEESEEGEEEDDEEDEEEEREEAGGDQDE